MPSPFPGMDPYLEQEILWHDFHERFLPAAAAQISAQVLPRYIVLIDEHVYLNDVEERETFLTVCDRASRQVITVIELLSPTNKRPGPNRRRYITKRADLLHSPAHLVEIDLLRGGPPMPAEDRPECVYSVLICRADARPGAGFWPIALREPLPTVPIPLRAGEPDAHLDLRATLDRVYDEAGYRYFLYEHPPDPPLTGGDGEWAELLAARANVDT
jgi:hypothetical protein